MDSTGVSIVAKGLLAMWNLASFVCLHVPAYPTTNVGCDIIGSAAERKWELPNTPRCNLTVQQRDLSRHNRRGGVHLSAR